MLGPQHMANRLITNVRRIIIYLGDATEPTHITVNGVSKSVTRNCQSGLKQLRYKANSGDCPCKYFWVDAICINQAKLAERNHQVNLMGQIFGQADRVFVSLGAQSEESKGFLRQIPSVPIDDWALTETREWLARASEDKLVNLLDGLVDIAYRPYWKRAWIVQQFVVAKELIICCGENDTAGWKSVGFLSEADLLPQPELRKMSLRVQVRVRSLHRSPMMPVKSSRNYLDRRQVPFNAQFNLFEYLNGQADLSRQCLDPRDKIYSLLGILSWSDWPEPIKADHSLTARKLALIIYNHWLHHYGSFEKPIRTAYKMLDVEWVKIVD